MNELIIFYIHLSILKDIQLSIVQKHFWEDVSSKHVAFCLIKDLTDQSVEKWKYLAINLLLIG